MLGMLLAMGLVAIVGLVALVWAAIVERDVLMIIPGLTLAVVGLAFGGIVLEDYHEYGTFAEAKKARAQKYVRCECCASFCCVECQNAAKKNDEEVE